MPKKSTKNPAKPEENGQSRSELRVCIKLTRELYERYRREADDAAMPTASLLAYALKLWADANLEDAVPVMTKAQEAEAAKAAAAMFGDTKPTAKKVPAKKAPAKAKK